MTNPIAERLWGAGQRQLQRAESAPVKGRFYLMGVAEGLFRASLIVEATCETGIGTVEMTMEQAQAFCKTSGRNKVEDKDGNVVCTVGHVGYWNGEYTSRPFNKQAEPYRVSEGRR